MGLSPVETASANQTSEAMPFDTIDVARVARAVEAKPHWLSKRLFGLDPRGLARLLRTLWVSGENTADELSVVKGAYDIARRESEEAHHRLRELQHKVGTVCYHLDRLIEQHGKNSPGVLVMSMKQYRRLTCEHECFDKAGHSNGERWAYTYRGFPVYTAERLAGPFIMEPKVFEGFKLALGTAITLREH